MRSTAKRAFATLATSAAVVMMAAAGASAATSGATPAPAGAAGVTGWEYMGEFSKSACYELRDSYAGSAKCVRNAGGLYDLYVWV
ncbi:hypothetical protein QLX52_27630 [Streptomyces albus]|uniref:hypothetical protein n=1 Tax=Streptomyces albus TaxID=1888 RepID=UPI0024ACFB00|nr:hypothetical protein [Streptomyces albus]MDI6412579.1 hypothetical protein [Streptomyces albus]